MRPVAVGVGVLVVGVAGAAMVMTGGSAESPNEQLTRRADSVISARGRRLPSAVTANRAGNRTMFRAVEDFGPRQRSRFAADAPSRRSADDRIRRANELSTGATGAASTRPGGSGTRATTSTGRPRRDPASRAEALERRRISEENRARQRELDSRERGLRMAQDRMSRLQEARMRATRATVTGQAQFAQRALAAPGEAGPQGAGEGPGDTDGRSRRDPNAPPTLEELRGLFEAFGINPNSTGSQSRNANRNTQQGRRSNNQQRRGGAGGPRQGGQGTQPTVQVTTGSRGGVTADISTVWVPVNQGSCAGELSGFRTNDLYVRIAVTVPSGVQPLESIPIITLKYDQIRIGGGAYLDADQSYVIPDGFALADQPCLEFDTFVSMGDSSVNPLRGPRFEDPLVSNIDVSVLNLAGVPAVRDRSILDDDAFYLRIARIAAPSTITNLTGQVNVGILLGEGFGAFANASAPVEFIPTVWSTLEGVETVWLPVDHGDCTETTVFPPITYAGVETYDLFVRRRTAFDLTFVTSLQGTSTQPLTVSGGTYVFHPSHDPQHRRPTAAAISANPCIAFDGFLAVDTIATPETPPIAVMSATWSWTSLAAFWGVPNLGSTEASAPETAARDPGTFGDDRFYVRVARVSVTSGTSISGSILVSWSALLPGGNRQAVVSVAPVCDFTATPCPPTP